MTIRIRLDRMHFYACHGALPHEAEVPQPFEVTVILDAALDEAVASDRLEDTVDYRKVYDIVGTLMQGPRQRLLEHLAGVMAERLLDVPRVSGVSVTVRKAAPPLPGPLEGVEVTVQRHA